MYLDSCWYNNEGKTLIGRHTAKKKKMFYGRGDIHIMYVVYKGGVCGKTERLYVQLLFLPLDSLIIPITTIVMHFIFTHEMQ